MESSYSCRIFFNQVQFSSYISYGEPSTSNIREIYMRHNFHEHSLYYAILLFILLSRVQHFSF